MFTVLMVALVVVCAPIARAIARSIERGRPIGDVRPDTELKKALQLAEQRLSDSETRLAALEERVDFYEKLLANPASSSKSESPPRSSQ